VYEELFNRPSTIDARDIADQHRMTLDGRSPKVRLTIITYMLENGVAPDLDDPKPFIKTAKAISSFVGEKLEDFALDIEAMADKRADLSLVEQKDQIEGGDPPNNGPYL